MLDRLLSVFVALGLALLLWLYARSREQEILDNVQVPVQITLSGSQAEQYNLETHADCRVMVSFSGPPSRIRELRGILQRGELNVALGYTVPEDRLTEGRYSDTILIEAADLHAPPGVTPMIAEGRNRIPITIHRLVERRLAVRYENDHEDQTGRVTIEPATVLVRGPQDVLDRTKFITTQPSSLPVRPTNAGPSAPAVGRAAVVTELEGRPVRVTPSHVTVRTQPRRLYEIDDVPVNFLTPPGFLLRPQFLDFDDRSRRVALKVWGPVQSERPHIYAFVDLSRERFISGLNHAPLELQLPKDFTLAQQPVRVVAFELLPADFVPRSLGTMPGP